MIELETDIFRQMGNSKWLSLILIFFFKKRKRKRKRKEKPEVTNNDKFSQKTQRHTHKATTSLISNQKLQLLTKKEKKRKIKKNENQSSSFF
jgi:hypothetical protein